MAAKKRGADVRRRLLVTPTERAVCAVMGCTNPTRAALREGFDQRLCRQHHEHYQRHGSPFRGSYTATELKPHRQKAKRWLKDNSSTPEVRQAIDRVRILYRSAGAAVPAYRLQGMSPRERARAAWARIREASVPPERIVAAWLSVQQVIKADPEADTRPEFARVQAAKIVHRLASGTRRVWEQRDESGRILREDRLEVYPRSRGRVLREIGEDIETSCFGLEILIG